MTGDHKLGSYRLQTQRRLRTYENLVPDMVNAEDAASFAVISIAGPHRGDSYADEIMDQRVDPSNPHHILNPMEIQNAQSAPGIFGSHIPPDLPRDNLPRQPYDYEILLDTQNTQEYYQEEPEYQM